MSFRGYCASLLRRRSISLPFKVVERVIRENQAQGWFIYVFKERASRWEIWEPSFWLARRLQANARILETGCGCGFNLIWFGQQGFQSLFGFDMDPRAIVAGKVLSEHAMTPITFWVDDALAPTHLRGDLFDAVLALNWTYLQDTFELESFLGSYRQYLAAEGLLVIDVIDASYDKMTNNQYLTSDWHKPIGQRQPSEYKKRYSVRQVEYAASVAGFRVIKNFCRIDAIPRRVFVLGL